jgi:L-alanine-DL-glutamate epimerase-like enolase superfamily enzyme
MKITDVRFRQVWGGFDHDGDFWEERLIMPLDVYPEYRERGRAEMRPTVDGKLAVESIFVEIETDEGITGLGGPMNLNIAWIAFWQFRSFLIGEDPMAVERIWDLMYRSAVHGRKGEAMFAISAIDGALWDLKGKALGVPVYSLLGGPIRKEIPVYASALGYSLEPEKAHKVAKQFAADGFQATKWFPRKGPVDGREGMRTNLKLAEALRDAVGPDVDIMLDAWMSWNVPYTLQMADMLQDVAPRWIEEPVLPDMIPQYADIRSQSMIPIAGGEHEYTRWGMYQLLEAGAVDVLQPDTYWAGGVTELQKIYAIASLYDIPVIPHGHSVPTNIHLMASAPALMAPILEYLVKWNEVHQFFFKDKVMPKNGILTVPDRPGMGIALNPDVIDEERYLKFEVS